MQQTSKPDDFSTKDFLNAEETASFLKVKLSTLYHYTHRRLIPYYRPKGSRLIYFKVSDLREFLFNEKNKILSYQQIEERAAEMV